MYSQTPEYNTAFRRRSQLGIQKKGIGGFLIPDCRQRKTDKTTTKRKWTKRQIMVHKSEHRKLKIWHKLKTDVNASASGSLIVKTGHVFGYFILYRGGQFY